MSPGLVASRRSRSFAKKAGSRLAVGTSAAAGRQAAAVVVAVVVCCGLVTSSWSGKDGMGPRGGTLCFGDSDLRPLYKRPWLGGLGFRV